ncbi:hypothetical protein QTN93_09040 [Sphingomonas aerolata]|uniref:hypothetical protein n=1 Tax=Sphingomonas TaxID=13687 RepID=UPI001AE5AA1C|nr:hypothetical protein [Sphingomonas sp. PvP018]MBP2514595.1 hypothetical protein [Sphingomonas sp. PvP018]
MIAAVAMQEIQIMEPSPRNGKEHAPLRGSQLASFDSLRTTNVELGGDDATAQ